MPRVQETPITSSFVLNLLALTECKTIQELSEKTGIHRDTLRDWAIEKTSPERTLRIALALESATGKPLRDLLIQTS